MIYVTVGTHEQQFDRLVRAVDELAAHALANESIFIQVGYCTYEPAHCGWSKFLAPDRMGALMREADVLVTHGGPSSFMEAMAAGKVPVVIPRCKAFGEHVNDHQVDFVDFVAKRQGGIIPVYDMDNLKGAIEEARTASSAKRFTGNNSRFCERLCEIIEEL